MRIQLVRDSGEVVATYAFVPDATLYAEFSAPFMDGAYALSGFAFAPQMWQMPVEGPDEVTDEDDDFEWDD